MHKLGKSGPKSFPCNIHKFNCNFSVMTNSTGFPLNTIWLNLIGYADRKITHASLLPVSVRRASRSI